MDTILEVIAVVSGIGGIMAAGFNFAANQGKQIAKLDRVDKDLNLIADMYRGLHDKLDGRLDLIDQRLSRLEGKYQSIDNYKPCEGWID
jgi:hypothetical protein